MTIGRIPEGGLSCPLCSERLETWTRRRLVVDFCDRCEALFLDRGELFQMFRAEGYSCPPEAFLRASFTPHEGETLTCPKCEKRSLQPGALEGCEVWHCIPCNGFLIDRSLLLGVDPDEAPLEMKGFTRRGANEAPGDEEKSGYFGRIFQAIAFWTSSHQRELD